MKTVLMYLALALCATPAAVAEEPPAEAVVAEAAPASETAEDAPAGQPQGEGEKTDESSPSTQEVDDKVNSLTEAFTEAKNTIEALSKLKISGYVQAQYVDDERSESEFAGGTSQNRDSFSVRRGRLNVQYQALPTGRLVIQPDFSSSGVAIRDAYLELSEPWTQWRHTLVAGQFKWPFGFEVLYSSRDRELPERSLVVRTLFPGERDRGFMLRGRGMQDRVGYWLGVFNGNGTAATQDLDKRKDAVGRVQGTIGPVDIGGSVYRGEELVPTAARPSGQRFDKERNGFDLQVITPLPGLGVRGEYIEGKERGADVDGWYLYAIQNIGTRHQIAARLDEYDPNRDLDDNAIQTVALSYIFWWDANSKVMLAYEMPERETNDIDDNVLTIRYQFQF
jgi:hypothetical protein